MKSITIVANADKDVNSTYANKIISMLTPDYDVRLPGDASEYFDAIKGADALVVLGGDGTILTCASIAAKANVPILGINLGTLGFLAEVEKEDAEASINALLEGRYTIENRLMLKAEVMREGEVVYTNTALNDFVVSRSSFRRMISTGIYVDSKFVAGYDGDGIIVATPTGSTGYNLSAGGPIIDSALDAAIITPVCPHSNFSSSIVVPASKKITVCLRDRFAKCSMLTTDGQHGFELESSDEVVISADTNVAQLIKVHKRSLYDVLRLKNITPGKED